MKQEYITTSPGQTKKLGKILAKKIIRENSRSNSFKFARIIGLEGDLGAGKTTFLQGFAKGLGIREKILSPTFVILKRFKITKTNNKKLITNNYFKNFYHIDCYRIKKPKELLNLDLKEIISNPQNIVTIEWVERVKKILPQKIILVKFKFIYPERNRRVDKNKRKIKMRY